MTQQNTKNFSKGIWVTWDTSTPQFNTGGAKALAEAWGDGPFRVTIVEDVRPENQAIVGHHQFVKIDVNGNERTFSGACLKQAPNKE